MSLELEKNHLKAHYTAESALDHIQKIYTSSCDCIRENARRFARGDPIDKAALEKAVYPYVFFEIDDLAAFDDKDTHLSYGVLGAFNSYGVTLTEPVLFKNYYIEQFSRIMENHNIPAYVGLSERRIPLPYVQEVMDNPFDAHQCAKLSQYFAMPNLEATNDTVANSLEMIDENGVAALSLFSAERVDYSLNRLHHYTDTHPKHFQGMILFTNYQRYVQEFFTYAADMLEKDPENYTDFVGPSGLSVVSKDVSNLRKLYDEHKLPQMPAYHLKRKDGCGVTLVNIGVGPSNAKTITDHIAVLRPHCWLMIGHCGGLRRRQMLGDYVLAHAYLRDDHVLDAELPTWIPVPSLVEIQLAVEQAFSEVTHLTGIDLKCRLRTGTVATTDNRNWELRTQDYYQYLRMSRAIAIDMESATIAANGFRFRVPYGALLCVSDKPIHGEIKLRGMANAFYEERIQQHLYVGLRAIEVLRDRGIKGLHSRKLRGFHEVPFR